MWVLLKALILGIGQGATDYLPVSGVAQRMCGLWWSGWFQPARVFGAALPQRPRRARPVYFWRDWLTNTRAGLRAWSIRSIQELPTRLLFLIAAGALFAAVTGVLLDVLARWAALALVLAAALVRWRAAGRAVNDPAGQPDQESSVVPPFNALWAGLPLTGDLAPGAARLVCRYPADRGCSRSCLAAARLKTWPGLPVWWMTGADHPPRNTVRYAPPHRAKAAQRWIGWQAAGKTWSKGVLCLFRAAQDKESRIAGAGVGSRSLLVALLL